VEETPIDEEERVTGFCLDDAQLGELVRLGVLCETHFGPGRDIEWAVEKNVLYLLQCRSITVGAPT
jgi:phosphoenolpyruvate synthase/pyruvate phosphate dikinase